MHGAVRVDEPGDDDGVFPYATRCKPSSPFTKLAATELSGLKHASVGTDEGRKAVDKMLRRIEQPIPK